MSWRLRQWGLARGGTQPTVKLPIQTPVRSPLGAGTRWAAAAHASIDATIPAHRRRSQTYHMTHLALRSVLWIDHFQDLDFIRINALVIGAEVLICRASPSIVLTRSSTPPAHWCWKKASAALPWTPSPGAVARLSGHFTTASGLVTACWWRCGSERFAG